MTTATLALHRHEAAALQRGSVLLLRPVELGVLHRHRILTDLIAPDQRDGETLLRVPYRSLGEEWAALLPCPLGRPGDVLETDAGPVTVGAVRVVKIRSLDSNDVREAGWGLDSPCPGADPLRTDGLRWPRLALKHHWAMLYPAHPWEQAWCWAVTVERRG